MSSRRRVRETFMARYFLIHEYDFLEQMVRPALGKAWLTRSFAPCRDLCRRLLPLAEDYARRYCVGGETVLAGVLAGLAFDHTLWRALAGEVLLYGAADVPELPPGEEAIGQFADDPDARDSPVRHALYGTRELTFGPVAYRPEHAGYNNRTDVVQLAGFFGEVDTASWEAEDDADEDALEALAYAREGFAALAETYRQAAARGRVVVVESVY